MCNLIYHLCPHSDPLASLLYVHFLFYVSRIYIIPVSSVRGLILNVRSVCSNIIAVRSVRSNIRLIFHHNKSPGSIDAILYGLLTHPNFSHFISNRRILFLKMVSKIRQLAPPEFMDLTRGGLPDSPTRTGINPFKTTFKNEANMLDRLLFLLDFLSHA